MTWPLISAAVVLAVLVSVLARSWPREPIQFEFPAQPEPEALLPVGVGRQWRTHPCHHCGAPIVTTKPNSWIHKLDLRRAQVTPSGETVAPRHRCEPEANHA